MGLRDLYKRLTKRANRTAEKQQSKREKTQKKKKKRETPQRQTTSSNSDSGSSSTTSRPERTTTTSGTARHRSGSYNRPQPSEKRETSTTSTTSTTRRSGAYRAQETVQKATDTTAKITDLSERSTRSTVIGGKELNKSLKRASGESTLKNKLRDSAAKANERREEDQKTISWKTTNFTTYGYKGKDYTLKEAPGSARASFTGVDYKGRKVKNINAKDVSRGIVEAAANATAIIEQDTKAVETGYKQAMHEQNQFEQAYGVKIPKNKKEQEEFKEKYDVDMPTEKEWTDETIKAYTDAYNSKKAQEARRDFAKKYAEETIKKGHVSTERPTQEEFLLLQNAQRMGGGDIANKALGDELAYKFGANTAVSANKGRFGTGLIESMSYGDIFHGGAGKYDENSQQVLKEYLDSKGRMAGNMVGIAAQMGLGGITAGRSLADAGAKRALQKSLQEALTKKYGDKVAASVAKKVINNPNAKTLADELLKKYGVEVSEGTLKKIGRNTVGDAIASLPFDIMDSIKQSTDETGKINKDVLAVNLATNIGLGGVMGGGMEVLSSALTKGTVSKLLRLQAKANNGTATAKELAEINNIRAKLAQISEDVTSSGNNVAREGLEKADKQYLSSNANAVEERLKRRLANKGVAPELVDETVSNTKAQKYIALRAEERVKGKLSPEKAAELKEKEKQFNLAKHKYEKNLGEVVSSIKADFSHASDSDIGKLVTAVDYYTKAGMRAEAKEASALLKKVKKVYVARNESLENALKVMTEKTGVKYRGVTTDEALSLVGRKIDADEFASGVKWRNPETGEIEILVNKESPEAYQTVVGHEAGHLIKMANPKEFANLGHMLRDYSRELGEWDSFEAQMKRNYPELEGRELDEEITCELLGRYIFGEDDVFINRLAGEHPNVFRRVIDYLKSLAAKVTDPDMSKRLAQISDKADSLIREVKKSGIGKYKVLSEYEDAKTFDEFVDKNIDVLRQRYGAFGETKYGGDEMEELWRMKRSETLLDTAKEISDEDAIDIIRREIPESQRGGWFRNADSAYKPNIAAHILGSDDALNAGWNLMYRHYKEVTGESLSFDEFMDSTITLYRGERGQGKVSDDVFNAYSFDRKMAEKFADGNAEMVDTIQIKPSETWGSYQTTAEAEVLVPEYKTLGAKFSKGTSITPEAITDGAGNITKEADDAYMKAAEKGDYNTAQKFVDATLEAKGYTIDAYHGTKTFGFTKFDLEEMQKIDSKNDFLSVFTTDSPEMAGSYAERSRLRDVSDKPHNVLKEKSELFDELMDYADDIDDIIENAGDDFDAYFDTLRDDVRKIEDLFEKNDVEYSSAELADAAENGYVGDYLYQVAEESAQNATGIYHAKLKMENPYIVEGNGRQWNDLLNPIPEPGVTKTRDVVKWALENKYDGVIFKDIKDFGEFPKGKETPHNVFVVFNSNQFKSADPITRDDAGNIIPLSKRGSSDEDIRFSKKKIDSIKAEYSISVDDALEDLNKLHDDLVAGKIKAGEFGKSFAELTDDLSKPEMKALYEQFDDLAGKDDTYKNFRDAAYSAVEDSGRAEQIEEPTIMGEAPLGNSEAPKNTVREKPAVDTGKKKTDNAGKKDANTGKQITKKKGANNGRRKETSPIQRGEKDLQRPTEEVREDAKRTGESEVRGGNEQNAPVGSGRLGRNDVISKEQRDGLAKHGVKVGKVVDRSAEPEAFIEQLQTNAKSQKFGVAVDSELKPEDLKGAKLYTASMGNVTIGVKKDGDIFGLAKNSASHDPEAFNDAMFAAIANGGKKMDNYGIHLTNKYAQYGFEPVARLPYNPAYVSEEAKPVFDEMISRGIVPDVYVMKHSGDSLEEIARKRAAGEYKIWTQKELDNLKTFEDYDKALAYRDDLIEFDSLGEVKKFDGEAENGEIPNAEFQKIKDAKDYEDLGEPIFLEKTRKTTIPKKEWNEIVDILDGSETVKAAKKKTKAQQLKESRESFEAFKKRAEKGEMTAGEISQHVQTMYEAGVYTAKEIKEQLFKDLKDGTYAKVKRESYADAIANAEKAVEEDWRKVYERQINIQADVDLTARDKAERTYLLNKLTEMVQNKEGDVDELVKMHRDLAIDDTLNVGNTAAALAANRMMKMLDPNGRALIMLRKVDKMNKMFKDRLKGKTLELTDEQYNRILAAETPEEGIKVMADITDELMYQVPSTLFEKVNDIRKFMMLSNLRTHERNIIGNGVFAGARYMSDAMEVAAYKIPAVRNRVEKLGGTVDKTKYWYWNDVKKNKDILKERFDDIYNASGSATQYRDAMRIGNPKPFKSKIANKILDFNYDMLEKEDMILFKPAFNRHYMEWCNARGISDLNGMTKTQKELAGKYALEKAEYATFRDDSIFSKKICGWKMATAGKKGKTPVSKAGYRALNMALEGHLPFVKTPINILRRSVDYSPLGIAKGVVKLGTTDNPELFKQGVHEMCSGMTGTGVFMFGMLLAHQGAITVEAKNAQIDGQKTNDAYYNRDMGFQDYSLIVGFDQKFSMSIDWASPMQTALFMGAAVQENLAEHGFEFQDMADVAVKALNPMLDMSFMSSSKDTFDAFTEKVYRNGTGDDADWTGAITQTVFGKIPQNYLGSLVPQSMAQLANATDMYQRDTSSTKEGAVAASWDIWGKQLKNKVPWLRIQNNKKLDRMGQDKMNLGEENTAIRFLNAMANPSNMKRITTNDTDKELIGIYNDIPENDKNKKYFWYPFLGKPDYDLYNGERMTSKEAYDYSQEKRQSQWQSIKDMLDTDSYKNMPNTLKVKEIKDYGDIGDTKADLKVYGADYTLEKIVGTSALTGTITDALNDAVAVATGDRDGVKSDAQAWRIYMSNHGDSESSKEKFCNFWIEKEGIVARAHDSSYETKAFACAMSGDDDVARAYDINADKMQRAKDYVENKGKDEAYKQYTNACCNIESGLENAHVESSSKANRSWSAAGYDNIDEATYRCMGFDWDSAQSGAGLRQSFGYDVNQLIQMKSDCKYEFDKNENGSINKDEAIEYIDSLGITGETEHEVLQQKACLFEYIMGGGANNPYDSIDDYLHWGENIDEEEGKGKRKRRGRRGGRRGRRGGGGSGGGGEMPNTTAGTYNGDVSTSSVSDFSKVSRYNVSSPLGTSNTSTPSNLDEAYRRKVRKLREASRRKPS